MDPISLEFENPTFQDKIKAEVPGIILKADSEATRLGRSGLLKGTMRKRHLLDFLIEHFGESRVRMTDLLPEIDIIIDSIPLKIRTITGKSGVKIKWTIDREKAIEFMSDYKPSCGILLLRKRRVNDTRDYSCGLFWIPITTQNRVLEQLGLWNYLEPPKPETNSRGIELNKFALEQLISDSETKHINLE
jgi:hypothetical protein